MITPDTKDWTWVLDAPCPECGLVAADVAVAEVGRLVRENAARWPGLLAAPGAARRPDPGTWSPTEYGAHVRDVHRVFAERVRLMLDEHAPTFDDWDQDAAAVAGRYDEADPTEVAADLVAAAEAVADLYDDVPPSAHDRPGSRSNGSVFTVASIARYHLHDVVHHLHDLRR
ncbi:DinB family protein [Nocardioides sp. C4-1]|uniref:DinB family protein n=1 Tax=Nocardioides sp. C4-1 TaxID=3151851 RepID=UPI003262D5B7